MITEKGMVHITYIFPFALVSLVSMGTLSFVRILYNDCDPLLDHRTKLFIDTNS